MWLLDWIVCHVFEGCLEVARHADHGDTLLNVGAHDVCAVLGACVYLFLLVCCVFEGFLEVINRHADHGDTLLTGYPGTRRVLGWTRTRWRVVPVRVNTPGTRVVNEPVVPLLSVHLYGGLSFSY